MFAGKIGFFRSDPSLGSLSSSDQGTWKNLLQKIEQVIENFRKNQFPASQETDLVCPITLDFIENPVVTSCGHLFEQAALEQGMETGSRCCLCRGIIQHVSHVVTQIKEYAKQRDDLLVTMSGFRENQPEYAQRHLEIGNFFVQEKRYKDALQAYEAAFRYTNASADYQTVPVIYGFLGEIDKKTLSLLHLILYQLKEQKIQEAIKTSQSVISSCKNPTIEKECSEILTGLTSFQGVSKIFSREVFLNKERVCLPPLPQDLAAFLQSDCPFHPGKTRKETHVIVPLFSEVSMGKRISSLTLATLLRLTGNKTSHLKKNSIYQQIEKDSFPSNFCWGVFLRVPIHNLDRPSSQKRKLLPEGYSLPRLPALVLALCWAPQEIPLQFYPSSLINNDDLIVVGPGVSGKIEFFFQSSVPNRSINLLAFRAFPVNENLL